MRMNNTQYNKLINFLLFFLLNIHKVQTINSNLKKTKQKINHKILLILQFYLLHASAELLMRTYLGINKSFIVIKTPLCYYSEVIHAELLMG